MQVESSLRSENILQRHVEVHFTATGTLSSRRVSSREGAGSASRSEARRRPDNDFLSFEKYRES